MKGKAFNRRKWWRHKWRRHTSCQLHSWNTHHIIFLHQTVTATDTFGIHLPQGPLQSLLPALQADRLVTNRLDIPREHTHIQEISELLLTSEPLRGKGSCWSPLSDSWTHMPAGQILYMCTYATTPSWRVALSSSKQLKYFIRATRSQYIYIQQNRRPTCVWEALIMVVCGMCGTYRERFR